MPRLTIEVSDDVSHALTQQARRLLLGRRQYVRAVIAAVAAEADRLNANQPEHLPAVAAHVDRAQAREKRLQAREKRLQAREKRLQSNVQQTHAEEVK